MLVPSGLASLVYHLYVIRSERKLDFAALSGVDWIAITHFPLSLTPVLSAAGQD